ncbi:MAG: DNA polymerase III subunit gamma/tau [Armatimonadetes bacterium]|nr:DNA polymerase III subunit gamma/tau [Armatimonadota bacterium]
MSYLTLYRKYRSQTFDEVLGQDHVVRTLRNAIQQGRIAHAYLFCGTRGTGKTTTARLLAKALNCEQGPTLTPCNECEMCRKIAGGTAVDVAEIDAASNRGIEHMRDLREKVKLAPMEGRYKIYIIDEAHQLTGDAKDAFLKTLEEPPAHVIFILATTEAHAMPITILSRCQRFDFHRGTTAEIGDLLRRVVQEEGREIEDAAVNLVARNAGGSWRDSLSLLEQILAYGDKKITVDDVAGVLGTVDQEVLFKAADVIAGGKPSEAFGTVADLLMEGKDLRQLLESLALHFRDILVLAVGGSAEQLAASYADTFARMEAQAARFTVQGAQAIIQTFAEAEREMRFNDQHRLLFEMAMLKAMREAGSTHLPAAAPQLETCPAREPETRETPHARPAHMSAEKPAADAGSRTERAAPTQSEPVRPKEPEPAPASEAAPVGALSVSLDQVRRVWNTVLELVKKQKGPNLSACLREGQLIRIEDCTLVVAFPYPFHKARVEEPNNRRVIEEVLRSALSSVPLRLRCELKDDSEGGGGGRGTGKPAPPQDSPRSSDPLPGLTETPRQIVMAVPDEAPPENRAGEDDTLKDVLTLFNGKIVQDGS